MFYLVMDDLKPSYYSKGCGLTRSRKPISPPIDFFSTTSPAGDHQIEPSPLQDCKY